VKIIAILVALGLYGALCYHLGGLPQKLKAETTVATQATTVSTQEAKQLTNNQTAEEKKDAELASLPPPSIHPVYIVRNASCPPVVQLPPKASGSNPPSGTADKGSGGDSGAVDIRATLNAFESRYETALANCREDLAKWPVSP
jgi:hypothetical protein